MDDRDVEALVALGLTGYEGSAYVALTRRGQATGAEVARLAELPRQRVYDVLGSLVSRGLAVETPGRPTRYTAAPPDVAFEGLLEAQRERLGQLERDVAGTLSRLVPIFRAGRRENDPMNFIEVLRGPALIAKRFAEYQASAEREILVFTKPPYALEPGENVEGVALLQRNIEARSIYERSISDDPAHVVAVQEFIAAGEQARVVDELPVKLVLIDERVALFTLEDPVAADPELTIVIVENAAWASLLKIAFDAIWERAEAFPAAVDRDAGGVPHGDSR
ncbi:MAG TPA: helix-turn-helix domain-containing protein [Solirubrobacteraceae bacterium]|nr:helix-turn-helix domain-containing protein [Solirubrobacteraceae bacterium]